VQRGRNFIVLVICIAAMIVLYASWRRSEGAERYRMAWIGTSLSAVLMGYCVSHLADVVNWQPTMELNIVINAFVTSGYFGLAFGLLRHRLFNISFAVNRTLVFTLTSLMLFLTFWLIEQVVHKLVHFDAVADNAMLSGAIAFGLFFAFNRLHHRVEHWIDHLFFAEWRANEQALRQFMAKAAHFLTIDALVAAFGAALDRFSDQAGNAIYLIGPNQQFHLVCSTIAAAPDRLPVDDNIAVTLRDTRSPMQLDVSNTDLQSALVLPMLQGSVLKGFVVMGAKTSSQGYRPDEEAVLTAAAALIALDINRLEAAQAAQEVAQMALERKLLLQRQNFLEQELAALHLVLSKAVPAPGTRAADLA
jgi:GAF domain-containing protein